jgi:SET domain-containing protein
MKEEKNYMPLPDFLDIKKSKIHGRGLFATKDIKAETVLGISHLYLPGQGFQDDLFRSPIGGYYNHTDENPNARTMKTDIEIGQLVFLIANRDIKKGEEILVTYSMAPLK